MQIMQIEIAIPAKEEIFAKGIPLSIAAENESWYGRQLGTYIKDSGVYIHHANNIILYVGQTSKEGIWGNFNVRLRRECQLKAAGNSYLYQLLREQHPAVKTSLYNFGEVYSMFQGEIRDQLSHERLTLILEQFMIAAYQPRGNRR
ncbi:hypothetical protein [Mucilaginibacter lacusdianchii]|uniref:hypothetical protein n=1 Tax=Mucilaginibacter lacusdianchii TaxID=2684211 RepID=UPI00131B4464|nr:hypothetical protein [Mucilaginibacter sp. JXJ CY 39]